MHIRYVYIYLNYAKVPFIHISIVILIYEGRLGGVSQSSNVAKCAYMGMCNNVCVNFQSHKDYRKRIVYISLSFPRT